MDVAPKNLHVWNGTAFLANRTFLSMNSKERKELTEKRSNQPYTSNKAIINYSSPWKKKANKLHTQNQPLTLSLKKCGNGKD